MSDHQHRSNSGLKQINKSHKAGRHLTKSAQKKIQSGRVNKNEERGSVKKTSNKQQEKAARKEKMRQTQMTKKDTLLQAKRTGNIPPKIVAVISLHHLASSTQVVDLLKKEGTIESPPDNFRTTLTFTQWKTRVTLLDVPRDFNSTLDAARVADLILFVVPIEGTDLIGERLITIIKSQGMPSVMGIVQGVSSVPPKEQKEARRDVVKLIEDRFSSETKSMSLDTPQEAPQVARFVAQMKVKDRHEVKPYLLSEETKFIPGDQDTGTLQVSGWLRGGSLNVNHLVHIPEFGDYQLLQISTATPYSTATASTLIAAPDPHLQETLDTENEVDPFAAEQTWPTAQELQDAKDRMAQLKGKKAKRKVPRGTSEYQAAWILEEADAEEGDDADMEDQDPQEEDQDPQEEETHTFEDAEEDDDWLDMDHLDEQAKLDKYNRMDDLQEKEQKSEEDEQWPDEVDTPLDQAARLRFQKYRGLKSFRSSPWDPKESLPVDYSKIFQFENFNRAKRRVLAGSVTDIPQANYITLHIKNVPYAVIERYTSVPLVIGGLKQYENKVSILNFTLTKYPTYLAPVKSKEALIFHWGFRRATVYPIFSEHNVRCDKQKYERFLHAGQVCVASIFGPITFPPSPLLVFKETPDGLELVATGNLMTVDPDRVILKKIILTGSPFKIHKKTAVVRHMFFEPDDIKWFKPVELWTKRGRVGHIKEPLGTHGYMKCIFDDLITGNDTICMSLYKRIFPPYQSATSIFHQGSTAVSGGTTPAVSSKDTAMDDLE